jgi:hypothetical protein
VATLGWTESKPLSIDWYYEIKLDWAATPLMETIWMRLASMLSTKQASIEKAGAHYRACFQDYLHWFSAALP